VISKKQVLTNEASFIVLGLPGDEINAEDAIFHVFLLTPVSTGVKFWQVTPAVFIPQKGCLAPPKLKSRF
jgi:hypothetical protein